MGCKNLLHTKNRRLIELIQLNGDAKNLSIDWIEFYYLQALYWLIKPFVDESCVSTG